MFQYLETGSRPPAEYRLMIYINRFGVPAVMGRDYLGAGEIRRMVYCDNLAAIVDDMSKAVNIVTWQKEHPDEWRMYTEAQRIADGE